VEPTVAFRQCREADALPGPHVNRTAKPAHALRPARDDGFTARCRQIAEDLVSRVVLITDHVHDHTSDGRRRVALPAAYEEKQEGAIVGLVAQLYDAVLDDCAPCREQLLTLLKEDAATTGMLVYGACLYTSETYGGLPEVLLEGSERADAPFHPTASFRTAAHAYDTASGTLDVVAAVCEACAELTPEERLDAATTSLELLVELPGFGVDFLYQ